MKLRFVSGFVTGFLIFMLTAPAVYANSAEQIFAQASPSIVVVDIFDANGKNIGLGSGVVIGVGNVITNCHVAQEGKKLQVRHTGKVFKATLQYADPSRDLCQLNAPGLQAPPVNLGTANKLRVGQRVYAIGTPKGLELTLSEGLISSLRLLEGSQYIQTSAAISSGSSGGGLFDDQGRLIGITTFQLVEGQNLNFALPVDWIGELPKRAQAVPATAKKGGLDWLNRSLALDKKKDWHGMLRLSQQWVNIEPESAIARIIMGSAYSGLKQYDQAIQAYREALRIQPEYAAAWNHLGVTYLDLKQYDKAIQACLEALRIQPGYTEALSNLGSAYRDIKQYDRAIQAVREALRIQPEYAVAWYNLGYVFHDLQQYDKAIQAYREALRIQPDFTEAWGNLGSAYSALEQYDQAINAHRAALRIQPEYFLAWNNIGFAYAGLKQYDQAIQAYREALRIQPENAGAWHNLGVAYVGLEQYEQAIQAYREALRIQPEYAVAWHNMGYAYNAQGRRDKVLEIYQILRKLDPAVAERYFNDFILH